VIYDENELGADELQQGTHTLSYSYGRATKAVSLVPPAYYADLACERARFYLNDMLNASDNASMHLNSQEEREKGLKEARAKWGAGVHQDLAESMFYI
jgi:eukaryotic translation initiation factor 2C